ncbi:MAG: glucose-1-phosphate cytidylyltransferase [Planctomycetia bacterium]|nr:glucose-1-phosphate cytidylyltransferase [Planctomycetia bacterium]
MKTVILAGGYGTRISEESTIRPKPMVEIGGKPILWHIMKIYSAYGLNDFIICLGYKGHVIKEYFSNYFLYMSDVTYDLKNNNMQVHNNSVEPWKVTLVDTGEKTMTGGRIKRIKDYVGKETFCLTYGDGVSDINIKKLIEFHRNQKTLATLTAVQPPGRFGVIKIEEESKVSSFKEKPDGDGAWINAGFFVMEPGVFDYIAGDLTAWEHAPMQNLARDGAISAYRYDGFWHAMDNLRDKYEIEELWKSGNAPWKVW